MKTVSGRALARAAEKAGWSLSRINGSHHIYAKAGVNAILTIPIHGNKDLRAGTQRALMKVAGLVEKDLS